jgi:hypothetical protein
MFHLHRKSHATFAAEQVTKNRARLGPGRGIDDEAANCPYSLAGLSSAFGKRKSAFFRGAGSVLDLAGTDVVAPAVFSLRDNWAALSADAMAIRNDATALIDQALRENAKPRST